MKINRMMYDGGKLAPILTFVFILLKIQNIIDWSWYWVLSPIIYYYAIVPIILLIMGIAIILRDILKN